MIGVGGMATVFKALHIHFKELRALKVIRAELGEDRSFVKRFIQEAIVTRRLSHPNVVRVDDIETAQDGLPFMAMELVEGMSLQDALRRELFTFARAFSITKQIADGLDAAHELGLVHRDIKPSNIMLQSRANKEHVKVLDFGIARVKESRIDHNRTRQIALTEVGTVLGTPAYMSPEQANGLAGDEIDHRSDIYSLGVIVYRMLSGQLPFSGTSDLEIMLAHIKTAPAPLKTLRPDLPHTISDAVMACLCKDRESRPASCRQFVAALEIAMDRRAVRSTTSLLRIRPEQTQALAAALRPQAK